MTVLFQLWQSFVKPENEQSSKARCDIILWQGDLKMLTTIEAEIDVDGKIRLLEPLKVNKKSRVIITLIESLNLIEQKSNDAESSGKIDWNDEVSLRAAFAELEDEEREFANAGMADYVSALAKIDGE